MDKAPDAFRTISEVAEELAVPQHVLRFWETRFTQIKPMKRGGGRRYYRPDDVDLLRGIRHLLYGEGYTIRGVQRILREHGAKFVQTVWQEDAPQPQRHPGDDEDEAESGAAEASATSAPETAERARGLLGMLPSLFGQSAAEASEEGAAEATRREPSFAAEPEPVGAREREADHRARDSTAPAGPPRAAQAAAGREELRAKLNAALEELSECRRLLDAALMDEA